MAKKKAAKKKAVPAPKEAVVTKKGVKKKKAAKKKVAKKVTPVEVEVMSPVETTVAEVSEELAIADFKTFATSRLARLLVNRRVSWAALTCWSRIRSVTSLALRVLVRAKR